MGLLGAADLPAEPLSREAAITRAETLVAGWLCPGLPDLMKRQWTVETRLQEEARAYGVPLYGRRRLGPALLRRWPITALLELTEDGVDRLPGASFDTFSIRLNSSVGEFSPVSRLRVVFQTGWAQNNLPPAVREAVMLTARELLDIPAGVKAERVGDVTQTYLDAPLSPPEAARVLLAPWRLAWG